MKKPLPHNRRRSPDKGSDDTVSDPGWSAGNTAPSISGAVVETAVFRSGNSDAVRIPRKFEFPKGRVFVRKLANGALLIIPKHKRGWPPGFFDSLPTVSDDFDVPAREGPSSADEARIEAIFSSDPTV